MTATTTPPKYKTLDEARADLEPALARMSVTDREAAAKLADIKPLDPKIKAGSKNPDAYLDSFENVRSGKIPHTLDACNRLRDALAGIAPRPLAESASSADKLVAGLVALREKVCGPKASTAPGHRPQGPSASGPHGYEITKLRNDLKRSFETHETKSLTFSEREEIRALIASAVGEDAPIESRVSTASSLRRWLVRLSALPLR